MKVAFNIPGASVAVGTFSVTLAFPSASSVPSNTSVLIVVKSVAGLLKIYCPYFLNCVFTLDKDISILAFNLEAVAPVSHAEVSGTVTFLSVD